jgi:DNA replication protein DnaC
MASRNGSDARKPGDEIARIASGLRMPALAEYRSIIKPGLAFEENFAEVLRAGEMQIEDAKLARRVKSARFPQCRTFNEYERGVVSDENWARILALKSCDFIKEKFDVVATGNPGTGKTHIAVAIGHEAAKLGFSVRFYAAQGLAAEMLKAKSDGRLGKLIRKIRSHKLLIIDDIGRATFSRDEACMLFEAVDQRSGNASTIFTSQFDVAKWGDFLGGNAMAAAIVDRIHFRCVKLRLGNESYRRTRALHGAGPAAVAGGCAWKTEG